MAEYSIRDLERLSGIKAHTIRIWEKRYALVSPGRTGTNIRYYCDKDLRKLLNVSLLNRNGLKISHIASMDDDQIAEKIIMVSQHSGDFDSLIESLLLSMVDMNEEQFEKILSRAIMQNGFEDSITRIIYPFFEKIGILWQTGSINPAQEHFVSNLIRQKMIVAIDGLISRINPDPKHFLLFLPEGELHELGLLFYSFLLQKHGHKVTYLGQWVPLEDMKAATSVKKIDFLLTSIVSVFNSENLPDYLRALSSSFPGQTIFISGYRTRDIQYQLPENMIRLNQVEELTEFLESHSA